MIHSDTHLLLPIDSSRSKEREDHERVSSPIIGNDKHLLISDHTNNNIPFSKCRQVNISKTIHQFMEAPLFSPNIFGKNSELTEISLYEKAGLMHLMLNSKNNIHFAF